MPNTTKYDNIGNTSVTPPLDHVMVSQYKQENEGEIKTSKEINDGIVGKQLDFHECE